MNPNFEQQRFVFDCFLKIFDGSSFRYSSLFENDAAMSGSVILCVKLNAFILKCFLSLLQYDFSVCTMYCVSMWSGTPRNNVANYVWPTAVLKPFWH